MDEKIEVASIGALQVNAYGDQFFSNLNIGSFNKTNASTVFDAKFSKHLFRPDRLYVIVGTDSGLLPQYIAQKGLPEGSRYIFIEPETILNQLDNHFVLDKSEERFAFVNEHTWLNAMSLFKMTDYYYINAVSTYDALGAEINAMDAYAELSWQVTEVLRQLHYQTMITTITEPFIIQQINNLPDSHLPAAVLKDAFKGKTAFALGGGPSLDQAIPWLIEHRDYIVLMAVSRIAKRLIQVGLEPDFIFSVDPFPANYDISKELFSFSEKPVFIYSNHVYHELISQWTGRALYLDNRVPWQSSLNEPNISSIGPTVSNTIVKVAGELGFARIFLAGVDFCYTLDGFTHAQGSIESSLGARFNLTGLEVETNAGTMAPTGLDFQLARHTLEQQAKHMGPEYQLFNISSAAAKIEGINYVPLSSISLDTEPVHIEAIFAQHLNHRLSNSFYKTVDSELNRVMYQLKEIKKIAKQALECNEHLYNEQGIIENPKDKRQLDKLEHSLQRKHRDFSQLVQKFGVRDFLKMTKPFDDDSWTAEEVKWRLNIYYKSYIAGAKRLIELLEQANANVHLRAEEVKEHPDWEFITKQCRVEKSYGRVRLWRNLQNTQELTAHTLQEFAELEQLFEDGLTKRHYGHYETIKKFTNIALLKIRANSLFRHKKIDLLHHLLFALDKHQDQNAVIPYRYLINGYVAELEQSIDQALNCYQQVLEHGEGPLEEALARIVTIDLDISDGSLAHQAFECLAQLNPRYLIIYAESCRIHGKILPAIDAYIAYLSAFPEDLIAQLKLAQLYIEQKIYDGAELMVNHVLAKNPEQKTALIMKEKLRTLLDVRT